MRVKRWARRWRNTNDSVAFSFEDGDANKGDMMRVARVDFGFTTDFLAKDNCVASQAADLLAYEQLRANIKISKSETGMMFEDELCRPLMRLRQIPGGRHGNDWGVHRGDDHDQ